MTSWVVRVKATGAVLFETFNPRVVAALNTTKYEAVPILEYLEGLNRSIKEADGKSNSDETNGRIS